MVNENQENFEKKKKIIVISLLAGLVFITLIAGLFLMKKNKESRENNNIGEVVDENDSDQEDNDDDDHENDDVIVNEGDYFFNKTSGQVITNILLSLFTGVLFFYWENDKLPRVMAGDSYLCPNCNKEFLLCGNLNVCSGAKNKQTDTDVGYGIFEKSNLFGFASLGFLIFITLLVELILHLLIGSISYFFSKDKNKKYLHTLKMFWKKRVQSFSSLSKIKIFSVILNWLVCAFVTAILARTSARHSYSCCCNKYEIVHEHNTHYCLGYYKIELEPKKLVPDLNPQDVGQNDPNKKNDNSPADTTATTDNQPRPETINYN